ncbi:hypothetical protein NONI108955_11205 [Nocardia ninae]|uniref:Uncharacterized protein n=1 Tax=Nocardia ninae NBRC 108245 TaxID=1210091 RepID=A0A511MMU1_9NOCA|nr:hypothetical protein NN4_64520 [Nocardia ninae NBRC 108245]
MIAVPAFTRDDITVIEDAQRAVADYLDAVSDPRFSGLPTQLERLARDMALTFTE